MKDDTTDNKITSFEEMKKKLEDEKKNSTASNQASLNELGDIKSILGQMGIDEDSFNEILKSFDLESLMDSANLSNLSMEDVYKGMENVRNYEQKIKQEKQMYRTFNQWIPFRKPYNLSTLFQIERIKVLAELNNVQVSSLDSKNEIIEKLKPSLANYVETTLKKLDINMMSKIGQIIYSDGYYVVDKPMDENFEIKIDYFVSKALVMRVNDNGKHALVIPEEILEAIKGINFKEVETYNKLNDIINKTTMAYANSYGAFPKKLLNEAVSEYAGELFSSLNIESVGEYIDEILEFTFSKSVLLGSLYANVVYSDEYISHAVIEVTKNLIDIQNNNIKDYKQLSLDDINTRGQEYYHDNSLSLNEITNMLSAHNQIDSFEMEQLKNQIYIFSLLEFEPSLVLQILEMRYQMPEEAEYAKFTDILRSYYKNAEKWILKGHTSFEINRKTDTNSNVDMKNIISFDYFNNN